MRILGLDTSTRAGSIALLEDGAVRGGVDVAGALDHSERLLPAMEFLLDRLRLVPADLDGIAVTVGPGSFTGVRVGLATARGLVRAAGVPGVGVTTLEALARLAAPPEASTEWLCPWVNAGRGEVYAAAYVAAGGGLRVERAPEVAAPETWLSGLPAGPARFLGDGAEAHRGLLESRREGRIVGRDPWFLSRTVARMGAEILAAGEAPGAPLEPVYLRPSDAERGRTAR